MDLLNNSLHFKNVLFAFPLKILYLKNYIEFSKKNVAIIHVHMLMRYSKKKNLFFQCVA